MKRFLSYFIAGMRTGALFYLLVVLLGQGIKGMVYPPVLPMNIIAILVMSGLMGALTVVFDELEELPYGLLVLLHLLATIAILVGTCLSIGWGGVLLSPWLWGLFLLIYALVWLVQIWLYHKQAERINLALLNRKKITTDSR